MSAGVYKIVCDQGATFERLLTIKDSNGDLLDLTGYTARMQVRPEVESDSILVELTTENGRITLGDAAGTVSLYIAASDTAALDKSGFYDLEIIAVDGTVSRILKGKFDLDPEVTR